MAGNNSSRRNFLKSTAIAAAAGIGGRTAEANAQPAAAPPECGSIWERPPRQQGNNLNLIVIVSDTFRHDNLACYGPKWLENLETPNLDRFSKESVVFEDAYPEGMPTIVIRRTLYTGRRVIPCYYFRQHEPVQLPGWHHLYNEDQTLSETLLEADYITTLISDLPHQQRPGRNFHRGFHTVRWIRGQEFDYYGTAPHKLPDVSDIVSPEYLKRFPGTQGFLSQYKANRNLWKQQGESLSQIVADQAIQWLRGNFDQKPFYLHVEMFDSHEPWDPPQRFLEKYWKGSYTPSFIEPPYGTVPLPDEIKNRFRANYAGEVSCVDYWIGRLLDTIRQYGLLENSVVVFMSDHGAMLGEHGQFLKGPDKLRGQVSHVPLMIRTPDQKFAGKKVPRVRADPRLHAHLAAPAGTEAARPRDRHEFLAHGHRRNPQHQGFCGAHLWLGRLRARPRVELHGNLEARSSPEQVLCHPGGQAHGIQTATLQPSEGPSGTHRRGRPLSRRLPADVSKNEGIHCFRRGVDLRQLQPEAQPEYRRGLHPAIPMTHVSALVQAEP